MDRRIEPDRDACFVPSPCARRKFATSRRWPVIGGLAAACLIGAVVLFSMPSSGLHAGSEARVGRTDGVSDRRSSEFYTSPEVRDAELKACQLKDQDGLRELLTGGKLFLVAPGSKVRILGRQWSPLGDSLWRVRVLDGEQRGRIGWTSQDCVVPIDIVAH